jgi:hypothetical protein
MVDIIESMIAFGLFEQVLFPLQRAAWCSEHEWSMPPVGPLD